MSWGSYYGTPHVLLASNPNLPHSFSILLLPSTFSYTRENLFSSNYHSKHEYNTIAITLHLSWCLLQKKTFYTHKLVCLFHLLAICLIKFNLFLQNLDSAGECHNLTKFSWIFKVVFPILYTTECSNQTKHTFLIWDCKAHLFFEW